jgi:hypothetical protein
MIETKGFIICSQGDPSVGIFPDMYELKGDFWFEDKNDLNLFKHNILKAFEYQYDDYKIYTFEEWDKYNMI